MTAPHSSTPSVPEDLTLPRILCLHGGGVTGPIFRAQFRAFLNNAALARKFRFVFVEGPFFCDEGPGVVPVYEDWGPFRRWFRWLPEHDEIEPDSCCYEIEYAIERGMVGDEGTGPWVGLLGFSQGAKLAASIMFEQQLRRERKEKMDGLYEPEWRFGVILAGRAPLVALSDKTEGLAWMQSAGGIADGVDVTAIKRHQGMRLKTPTVHVHGLQDVGLHLHQTLVNDYSEPGSVTLVEWNGIHRVPFKRSDVDKVADAIFNVAAECGL